VQARRTAVAEHFQRVGQSSVITNFDGLFSSVAVTAASTRSTRSGENAALARHEHARLGRWAHCLNT
jgi:hypothetical protein